MSYIVTKYPQGTFSWSDVYSTNVDQTKKFLQDLFGWTSKDLPTGPNSPDYTMFYLDGHEVAGASPTFMPQMPSFWSNYVTVNNVDEMVTKAESLGAKVPMVPMDVLDSGRMATIQDPTGAVVSLWQPKKHIGAQIVNTFGAMVWNELYTLDLETAKSFYTDLFGWEVQTDEKDGYTWIKNNGRSNGGMMQIDPSWGSMPPNWTVYFTVKNMSESVAQVEKLAGKVHMQKDLSVGSIAMVADPTGAAFMLIQMNVEPDHWEEKL